MKYLYALLILAFSISAGLVEFGAQGGLLMPSGDNSDAFSASPLIGACLLAHFPMYAVEGSISYAFLQPEEDLEDFSASLIPVLAGIRSYTGPVFYGGGAGMYMSSVSQDTIDASDEEFGAYGNLGMIFPTGAIDIEGSIKYHLVDFDTDKAWFSLTAATYF
ncbi:MAG: hypothetical protein GF388_03805 [Candidatus Aegiribacteria sp.]|nr:hypothetical protein [Candidatus Aegiribacteria sp.]MBD3294379.1 hypothetical protein [Candidatus Fermentibacteria bacterium]